MSGISPTAGVRDFITELRKISAQPVAASWPAMPQPSCNVHYLPDAHRESTSQEVPCTQNVLFAETSAPKGFPNVEFF